MGDRFHRNAHQGRLGELLEEGVGFAVDDAVALLDRGAADGLSQVALPRAGRADEQSVLALGDEAGGGELEDEGTVDLLVEGEVEAVERAFGVAEARLLVPSGEQPVLASLKLVGNECGDEGESGRLATQGDFSDSHGGLKACFTKKTSFKFQSEYRFAVSTLGDPVEPTHYITVSPELRELCQELLT